jgi:hypothetical protein
MEVYADIRQKVIIDPKDVIVTLIKEEIGYGSWIFEKDGLYYRGYEVSAGSHSYDESEEISKERFDYVKALELILIRLNK